MCLLPSVNTLLASADTRMYHGKHAGKKRVVYQVLAAS